MKHVALLASFSVLLVVSSALGFLDKPTEMALAIAAGALGLAFCNIERIERFKGAGFEAQMRMLQTTLEAQTEPTPERRQEAEDSLSTLSNEERKVLEALQRPGYTWRYAKTVAGEVGQSVVATENALFAMRRRGLTESAKGSNGEIWAATLNGKAAHEALSAKG